jgi:hypothetical protein
MAKTNSFQIDAHKPKFCLAMPKPVTNVWQKVDPNHEKMAKTIAKTKSQTRTLQYKRLGTLNSSIL